MAKQPYIPLYTGDYLKDTRILPLEVRGAWVDIMIFMWESKEKGTITGTLDEFALMLGCSFKKANQIIAMLQEKGICDYEITKNGHIKLISRRMVRDVELSKTRSEAGKEGVKAKLAKQFAEAKTPANSDNDNDSGIPKEKGVVAETLSDVEYWTKDVIAGNDETFLLMVKNQNIRVNGQLEPLARSHLALCSRYAWHKNMATQQAFRISLIDHITKELKNNASNKTSPGKTGPEPGKNYSEPF